jgi:hypothetical protein
MRGFIVVFLVVARSLPGTRTFQDLVIDDTEVVFPAVAECRRIRTDPQIRQPEREC